MTFGHFHIFTFAHLFTHFGILNPQGVRSASLYLTRKGYRPMGYHFVCHITCPAGSYFFADTDACVTTFLTGRSSVDNTAFIKRCREEGKERVSRP